MWQSRHVGVGQNCWPLVGHFNWPLTTVRNSSPAHAASYLLNIQAKLKSVRMDFISSLGEAETYKSLLTEHPFLREKLEATYHLTRDKSLNLMGQLRALEHTVKILEEQL
jgi:hypothetical protein